MEKQIEQHLVKEVKKIGGWCLKLPATYVAGLPDRLCLLPGGRVIFVELKDTGKKPTDIQLYIHAKLQALGFRVDVLDSKEKVNSFIKDVTGN